MQIITFFNLAAIVSDTCYRTDYNGYDLITFRRDDGISSAQFSFFWDGEDFMLLIPEKQKDLVPAAHIEYAHSLVRAAFSTKIIDGKEVLYWDADPGDSMPDPIDKHEVYCDKLHDTSADFYATFAIYRNPGMMPHQAVDEYHDRFGRVEELNSDDPVAREYRAWIMLASYHLELLGIHDPAIPED